MSEIHNMLDRENLIGLLFISVLATFAFFVRESFDSIGGIAKDILFLFSYLAFSVVIILILFYYLSRAYVWVAENKGKLAISGAILLALLHALFAGMQDGTWLQFLRTFAGDGVLIFAGMLSYFKWGKRQEDKR